jgi:ribose transport system permease protein
MDSVSMVPADKQANGNISNVFKAIRGFREGTLILIILAVCVIMSFVSPYFLTWPNIKAILL